MKETGKEKCIHYCWSFCAFIKKNKGGHTG